MRKFKIKVRCESCGKKYVLNRISFLHCSVSKDQRGIEISVRCPHCNENQIEWLAIRTMLLYMMGE